MYKEELTPTNIFQHDGCCIGGVPGHGAWGELLCLQESLLRRHEEVVSGDIQGINTEKETKVIKTNISVQCQFCMNLS